MKYHSKILRAIEFIQFYIMALVVCLIVVLLVFPNTNKVDIDWSSRETYLGFIEQGVYIVLGLIISVLLDFMKLMVQIELDKINKKL